MQVVPFSPASGLLEWCEDTQPLGDYLLGGGRRTGGAHGRYHQPGQLTFSEAMAQYNRDLAKDTPSDPAKRCKTIQYVHAACHALDARTCRVNSQNHACTLTGALMSGINVHSVVRVQRNFSWAISLYEERSQIMRV